MISFYLLKPNLYPKRKILFAVTDYKVSAGVQLQFVSVIKSVNIFNTSCGHSSRAVSLIQEVYYWPDHQVKTEGKSLGRN